MIINKSTIVFLLLLSALSLNASEKLKLTENDAVELGLKQNNDLKSSEITLQQTREQAENSWNNFLPDISLTTGISASDVFLSSDSDGSDPSDFSAYGGLSFTLGFDDFIDAESDKIDLRIDQHDYETERKALEVSIRKQYKYLQASKENLTLQENNIDLAQKQYDQAKINFQNGLISELSLLTSQNSLESLKPTYQDADTTYKQNLMSFKKLIGIDLGSEIELQGELEVEHYDLDAYELIKLYLSKRLDIAGALLDIESGINSLSSTKASNLLPTVTFSTYWNNAVSTFFTSPEWTDSCYIGAKITIPVEGFIPGSSDNLSIKSAEQDLEKYELILQETIISAEEDIRSILMELEGAWANIETTKLSMELAQKTYQMTEASFQRGSSEILDVEDAQNKLLEAKQDHLLSKYTYLAGVLDLEYALNTDIETITGENNE